MSHWVMNYCGVRDSQLHIEESTLEQAHRECNDLAVSRRLYRLSFSAQLSRGFSWILGNQLLSNNYVRTPRREYYAHYQEVSTMRMKYVSQINMKRLPNAVNGANHRDRGEK